jgi:protein-export membrane protein SecD
MNYKISSVFFLIVALFLLVFIAPQLFNFSFIKEVPFRLGLDLQGGTQLTYEADLNEVEEDEKADRMENLRTVIERRINLFGVSEPVVQVKGDRLLVELAGVFDIEEAIKQIGKTPYLEFREIRTEEETEMILEKKDEILNAEDVSSIENWELGLEDPYFQATSLTGRFMDKSSLENNGLTGEPVIILEFTPEGSDLFKEITARNVGNPLAVYIDGNQLTAPTVQEEITGGRAQITGKFSLEEAMDLVRNLNSGALPVPIKMIAQQTVGPTLGHIYLQQSIVAGLIGFLAVILFMIIFYKLPGLIAAFSLSIYAIMVLASFKIFSVTLTLSGIAGFLLSIGMAIDANILIFSRLREEMDEKGISLRLAIDEAFKRAFPSIRDGNLTTLIVAFILFMIGTSFVKGFALILIIGIIFSLFVSLVITRYFLKAAESTFLSRFKRLW